MSDNKPVYVLSYGGGLNSSALFFHILDTGRPLDVVVFANTGEEKRSTMDAVARMRKECNERGIRFKMVVSHLGRLFDYYEKSHVVPSHQKRDCTSKFKIAPIRKWLRTEYGKRATFVMYIGFTWDEMHRMKDSDVQYIRNDYPFCDDRMERESNKRILNKYEFEANKSACKGCIFNKRHEWLKLFMNDREEFNRLLRIEQQGMRYPQITLTANEQWPLERMARVFEGQQSIEEWADWEDAEMGCGGEGGCWL